MDDVTSAPSDEIFIRVLGYLEDGEWVALALEMDLRGYGETFQDAFTDLGEIALMQIGFAAFKGQPEMIWSPAEPVWFARYEALRQERLLAQVQHETVQAIDTELAGMPIPPPHVIESLKAGFDPADA